MNKKARRRGANLLLMPRWGAFGAAVVLFLSYVLLFGLMTALAQRIFPMRYPWRALGAASATAIVAASIGAQLDTSLSAIGIKVLLLAGYVGIVVLTGGVTAAEIALLGRRAKPAVTPAASVGWR